MEMHCVWRTVALAPEARRPLVMVVAVVTAVVWWGPSWLAQPRREMPEVWTANAVEVWTLVWT